MEITPFISRVSEVAAQVYDENGYVTIKEVVDRMDAEQERDKNSYHLLFQRVNGVFLFLQQYGWNLWYQFTKTEKYNSAYKDIEFYKNNDDFRNDEHFKELYDKKIFSSKQMEESLVEAKIFEGFIKDLKNAGILFLVSGRGIKHHTVPNFYDYCIYKYYNIRATSRILRKQVTQFSEDGMILPEGVSVYELEDLSNRLLKALTYDKPEVSE